MSRLINRIDKVMDKRWIFTSIFFVMLLLATDHWPLTAEAYAVLTDESTINLKAADAQQQTSEAPGLIASFVKLFAGLAIVLGVMLIVYRFVKERLNKANAYSGKGKLINVIATQYLAPKKAVMLIEVAGERLIVGVGEEINLLARIEDVDQGRDFSDALQAASARDGFPGVIDSIKEKLERLRVKR